MKFQEKMHYDSHMSLFNSQYSVLRSMSTAQSHVTLGLRLKHCTEYMGHGAEKSQQSRRRV